MLCIRGEQLETITTAIGELIHNRQHIDLHEDDRAMLEGAFKVCGEVRGITATPEERAAAEEIFCKGHGEFADEIEVDDEASVSRADEGYWVSAWVWVPNDGDDACENCGNTLNDGSDVCDQCGGQFAPQVAA